jgi:hypothetical protein
MSALLIIYKSSLQEQISLVGSFIIVPPFEEWFEQLAY